MINKGDPLIAYKDPSIRPGHGRGQLVYLPIHEAGKRRHPQHADGVAQVQGAGRHSPACRARRRTHSSARCATCRRSIATAGRSSCSSGTRPGCWSRREEPRPRPVRALPWFTRLPMSCKQGGCSPSVPQGMITTASLRAVDEARANSADGVTETDSHKTETRPGVLTYGDKYHFAFARDGRRDVKVVASDSCRDFCLENRTPGVPELDRSRASGHAIRRALFATSPLAGVP